MVFTKKQVEDFKLDIQNEYVMLNRVKKMMMSVLSICCACVIVILFMRNGNYYGVWRSVAIVTAVAAGILSALSYLSYRNGRKHVLKKINYLDQNK